jgi:hypothetical protein
MGGWLRSARAEATCALARALLPYDWRYPASASPLSDWERAIWHKAVPVLPRVQRTEYGCSVAALGMLLAPVRDVPDALLEEAIAPTEAGADEAAIVAAAQRFGVAVEARGGCGLPQLDFELALGRPALIDFWASFSPDDDPEEDQGHYAVVVASDGVDYLVLDPYPQLNALQARLIPRAEMMGVWWDTSLETGEVCRGIMVTLALPHGAQTRQDEDR